ncbi:MAG: Asp-tRNA(Asn)/Glu-tRNA(Gln) amidotransferase subunit GatB [Chloroflexota bacterium]|nr:Asp-tRNA(Asn)/Glu-tRNA(Gln) amidotransferase subunit GatB [Chloroflexota bacterium]
MALRPPWRAARRSALAGSISCVGDDGPRDRERQRRDPELAAHARAERFEDAVTVATERPYEIVIGIETHVELGTLSKMFCPCSARWFGMPPNTLVCPVCLGLPGALPVPNRRAIELSMTAGLALHCEVPEHTKFDRKNYMYPDLPKGYQISQYDLPLNVKGWLEITGDDGSPKRIGIIRAHLEEDTGKLLHGDGYSLVDFNRSGVPLLEIVSAPDMSSVTEALAYAEVLREILIHSGVSEFRLEEGAARFDTNVSIRFREDGQVRWPPQSEIKNLNSLRAVEQAVTFESQRLWEDWQAGGEIRTRKAKITVGWSPETGRTFLQRRKEEAEDYRYFPEPDLVALAPSRETVEHIRSSLPEMPSERRARFVAQYGLSDYDARILVSDPLLAALFEGAVAAGADAKTTANWITGETLRFLRERSVRAAEIPFTAAQLAELVGLIVKREISATIAKDVFAEMWASRKGPAAIVTEKGLRQVSDEAAIASVVDDVISAQAKAVADYRGGNKRALEALFGGVMGRTKGKADPQVVRRVLTEKLG